MLSVQEPVEVSEDWMRLQGASGCQQKEGNRPPGPAGLSLSCEEPSGTAVPDTAMAGVRPRTFRVLVKTLAGIRLVQLLPLR